MNKLILALAILFTSCNAELAQQAYNQETIQPQTYTYLVKISATNTQFELEGNTMDEIVDTGLTTITGTQQKQYTVTGPSFNGHVQRFNGIGHVSIVVLKDGVNVWQQSITTPTGIVSILGI